MNMYAVMRNGPDGSAGTIQGTGREFYRNWSAFIGSRVEQDLRLPAELSSCRTPFDYWSVATQWSLRAARDYHHQACALVSSAFSAGRYAAEEAMSLLEPLHFIEPEQEKEKSRESA